ncbi:MAG TPA: hypothetical protein VEW70_17700 [Burkholderiales bacterium]|nr:hypothetical protein [Burkholderiales bacterium]
MNSETQAVYDALAANQGKSLRESANFDSNRAKLLADLKVLVADADKLIREAAGASTEQFAALQTRMEAKLVDARLKLARAGSVAGDKARQATAAAQAYARAKPWHAAGVLIAAGAILGLVLSRRSSAPTDSTGQ